MFLSLNRKLFIVASLLTVIRTMASVAPPQGGIMVPNRAQQQMLPAVVDPRKAVCNIQYINGKKIIPANNNNPAECQRDLIERAKMRQAQAIETAARAVQTIEHIKQEPKCVKSVDLRETQCIKTKLLNELKNEPEYTVTGEENKVNVFKKGKKIMLAANIQHHFIKVEKPPSEQFQIVKKAKEAYVFNAIGEVLSTKQTRKRPAPQCICPGKSTPQTAEGTPLINECKQAECKNYDLFVNILSNTTVSEPGPEEKKAKKEESNNKKEEGKENGSNST